MHGRRPSPKGETPTVECLQAKIRMESNQTSCLTVYALAWKKINRRLSGESAYGCERLLGICPVSSFLPSFMGSTSIFLLLELVMF